MQSLTCPLCGSSTIRTFSKFSKDKRKFEWFNGCNECDWENINEEETRIHHAENKLLSEGKTITSDDDTRIKNP